MPIVTSSSLITYSYVQYHEIVVASRDIRSYMLRSVTPNYMQSAQS